MTVNLRVFHPKILNLMTATIREHVGRIGKGVLYGGIYMQGTEDLRGRLGTYTF